jgi:hypothetical protein
LQEPAAALLQLLNLLNITCACTCFAFLQAQHRYGNNWKAISMLLPGRTNRAVKNLFVGNLKWGARLPEIKNRYILCAS